MTSQFDEAECALRIRHPRREVQVLQLDAPHVEQKAPRIERA